MIEKGKIVKIHYTVEVEGKEIESTYDKDPISYVQGQKQLLAAIQQQLEGHAKGDKVEFELKPEEAYGVYSPEQVEEIPKSEIPQWEEIRVGMFLREPQPEGGAKVGRIIEIRDDAAILNFNHPMAGKQLKYRVEIIDII